MPNYKIYKTITGKIRIKHECLECTNVIENDLEEAGLPDKCPVCSHEFTVPGEAERAEHEKNLRLKQVAKEQKRIEAANAAKLHAQNLLAIEKAREEAELAKNAEQARIAAIEREKASTLQHGKWTYRVVPFVPGVQLSDQLSNLINFEARNGWEFHSLEVVSSYLPPGCLGSLLGSPPSHIVNHVAIFRRPFDGTV